MREESPEHSGPLRTGWTTGACATAAACAAAELLFAGHAPTHAHLDLPRGREVDLAIADSRELEGDAEAAVIKDAGDDPDATHGARIWVRLGLRDEPGVTFHAGEGVGTVTRTGLALAVGEPAINPVPRQMLTEHLEAVATRFGYAGGFEVTIGADDGEAIAQNTMNPRLGILGGISILGTTGIVRPFSCAAYIASIHQGIDVARANGITHIAACTGSTSERVAQTHYDLPEMAMVEMGDFVGAMLKYLARNPIPRLTLVGGIGKFSKLAAGRLDTHSRKGGVDFDFIAREAAAAGATPQLQEAIQSSNTALEAVTRCGEAGVPLAERLCELAWQVARSYLPAEIALEVWAIDKPGNVIGRAGT
ncbi:MAG: cobalt-precorrin-5B (C(1))-methyltransferase, partial [Halofilum sp. (in: g-proteobacteria)]